MNKVLAHNWTGKTLTLVHNATLNGKSKTEQVHQTHPNYAKVMELYKAGKYDECIPYLNIGSAIKMSSEGKFEVRDGKVFFNGEQTSGYLFERILFFYREMPKQFPRIVKFAENLYKNPDSAVRNDLYAFLEHGGNPITEDGCFLAYKGVNSDFWSKTAGTIRVIKGETKSDGGDKHFILNSIGAEIEVERADVNSNGKVGCADGIHAGSFSYANDFKGVGKLLIVKINPRDVCSVPEELSYQKLRCCKYLVLDEETDKLDEVKNMNYDKAAQVRYHSKRGPDGKFASTAPKKPNRDDSGRFVSKLTKKLAKKRKR